MYDFWYLLTFFFPPHEVNGSDDFYTLLTVCVCVCVCKEKNKYILAVTIISLTDGFVGIDNESRDRSSGSGMGSWTELI
jgi:hypothetical protein